MQVLVANSLYKPMAIGTWPDGGNSGANTNSPWLAGVQVEVSMPSQCRTVKGSLSDDREFLRS